MECNDIGLELKNKVLYWNLSAIAYFSEDDSNISALPRQSGERSVSDTLMLLSTDSDVALKTIALSCNKSPSPGTTSSYAARMR